MCAPPRKGAEFGRFISRHLRARGARPLRSPGSPTAGEGLVPTRCPGDSGRKCLAASNPKSQLPQGSGAQRPSSRSGHAGHLDPPLATPSLRGKRHAPPNRRLVSMSADQAPKRRISHLGVRCRRWPGGAAKPGLVPGAGGEVGLGEVDLWVWRTNLPFAGPQVSGPPALSALYPAKARISAMRRCAGSPGRLRGARRQRGSEPRSPRPGSARTPR